MNLKFTNTLKERHQVVEGVRAEIQMSFYDAAFPSCHTMAVDQILLILLQRGSHSVPLVNLDF